VQEPSRPLQWCVSRPSRRAAAKAANVSWTSMKRAAAAGSGLPAAPATAGALPSVAAERITQPISSPHSTSARRVRVPSWMLSIMVPRKCHTTSPLGTNVTAATSVTARRTTPTMPCSNSGNTPAAGDRPESSGGTERVACAVGARERSGELDGVQHLKRLQRGDADEALHAQRRSRLLGAELSRQRAARTASQLTTRNPAAPSASSTDSMSTPQSVDRMGAAAGAAPEAAP
jgi:hypothetical protein